MKFHTATELANKELKDLHKHLIEVRTEISKHLFDKRTKETKDMHTLSKLRKQLAKTMGAINAENIKKGAK